MKKSITSNCVRCYKVYLVCATLLLVYVLTFKLPCKAEEFPQLNGLIDASKYQQAEHLAKILLKRYPDNAALHLACARLFEAEGKVNEEINEYLKVRQLDNKDLQSCLSLAKLYKDNLDLENSLQYARLAVFIQPNSIAARAILISTLLESNLIVTAEEEMESLLADNKNDPDVLNVASQLMRRKGNYAKARDYLEQTILSAGDTTKYEIELSDLLEHMGDYKAAKDRLQTLLGRDPDNVEARLKLASILEFHFFDFEAADKEYQQVLQVNANRQAVNGLARCRNKNNDLALRLKLWFKSL